MLKILAAFLSLLFLPGVSVSAIDCPFLVEEPVLVTSVGQNFDALMVKTIFDEMGVIADLAPMVEAGALSQYRQLVISPGISYKGMVASGTTVEEEIERTKAIVEASFEYNLPIMLMYLGGFIQGDAKSQELIELVAPSADLIIIYRDSGGPIDYLVSVAREQQVPVYFIDSLKNICEELKVLISTSE
ncbi:MAG: DUF6305 family protein [Limnochordia bacterium]|jgi:hypothetical protein